MAAVAYPISHDRRVPQRRLRLVEPASQRACAVPPGTYARRRAAAVLLVIGVILAVRAVLGALGGGPLTAPEPVSSPAPVAARAVVVQPGDTMWSIARRLDPNGDVRITVQRLAKANGGAAVRAGQRLVLP